MEEKIDSSLLELVNELKIEIVDEKPDILTEEIKYLTEQDMEILFKIAVDFMRQHKLAKRKTKFRHEPYRRKGQNPSRGY